MKLFLDTNILLDFILTGRSRNETVQVIFDFLKSSRIETFVTTQSILDMVYIAEKEGQGKSKTDFFINWMLNHFNVRSLDVFDLKLALEDPHPDFEDNAQIARAEDQRCDVFLTSDKKILSRGIDSMLVMTPEQFVERMRSA